MLQCLYHPTTELPFSLVKATKEADLMEREEVKDMGNKRPRTFGQFSGASSEGRGSFKRCGPFQRLGPVHAAM